ncbi:MAG: DUF4363 family protein [Christensenellales bacterium]|jgi:hypothetical protein
MVKRFIVMAVILIFLVAVCVWEEMAIHQYLSSIETEIFALQTDVNNSESIDNNDFLFKVKNLQELWEEKEKAFCVVLNHKDVEVIGGEIARLMGAVIINNKDEFVLALTQLAFYINNLQHIMGLSTQNLF